MVNRISSKRKVKRNFGTSKCGCFEGPLGNVLRTSWGRPESTFWGRPLKVRLGRPLDVILGRSQDVKLGRPWGGQIGPLGDILGTLERDVLGTNMCRLGVAKLAILGISFLMSFVLALRVVLVAQLLISGILFSIFLILAFYTSFLTTSFYTTSLGLLKSKETGTNLSTLVFRLLILPGTFFNLSISNLSILDFKLAQSTFLANFDVSTPVSFFKSAFVA